MLTRTDAATDLQYEVDDGIATITFNRPDRLNALTPDMVQRYIKLLRSADADPDVRVLILTGAGRGFCAGADLDVLDGLGTEEGLRYMPREGEGPDLATALTIPVLAALNGPAVGIGLAIALAADMRYVAEDAKLGFPFVRLGLVAEYGSAWLLPRIVGQAAAADLLLTGRTITGREAAAMGLAQQALPAAEVLPTVQAIARDIATNCAPRSLASIKQMLRTGAHTSLADAYRDSLPMMLQTLASPDLAEGVTAKLQRRPPNFLPRDTPREETP